MLQNNGDQSVERRTVLADNMAAGYIREPHRKPTRWFV